MALGLKDKNRIVRRRASPIHEGGFYVNELLIVRIPLQLFDRNRHWLEHLVLSKFLDHRVLQKGGIQNGPKKPYCFHGVSRNEMLGANRVLDPQAASWVLDEQQAPWPTEGHNTLGPHAANAVGSQRGVLQVSHGDRQTVTFMHGRWRTNSESVHVLGENLKPNQLLF